MFWCLSLSIKSAPPSLFSTVMSISMLLTSFLVTSHSTRLWSWFFYPRHADNVENRLTLKPKRLSARKMLRFSRLSKSFSTRLRLQFINYCFSWGGTWHCLQTIPRINISPLKWDSPLLFDWGTMKSSSEKSRKSANLKKPRKLQQWEIPHNKSWLMF